MFGLPPALRPDVPRLFYSEGGSDSEDLALPWLTLAGPVSRSHCDSMKSSRPDFLIEMIRSSTA